MFIEKKRAIWSWNYNYGEAYPMPRKNRTRLEKINTIARKRSIHFKFPQYSVGKHKET